MSSVIWFMLVWIDRPCDQALKLRDISHVVAAKHRCAFSERNQFAFLMLAREISGVRRVVERAAIPYH
jgi:hypothetical protein